MTEHKIGWLNMPGYKPETWNPIVGCSKISPGCDNCYAERMAFRIAQMELKNHGKNGYHYSEVSKLTGIGWTGEARLVNSALQKPLNWKEPRMIFVCSMSDLFYDEVSFEWIDAVFSVMSDNDQHIYVLLTKRPYKAEAFFDWKKNQQGIDWQPKDNIWIGITIENQEQANKRLPYLNYFYAAVKFVSVEPMLSLIDFSEALGHTLKWHAGGLTNCISWVICGGETGSKARPIHPDWVRSLRDQCKAADVPFFFKQWGKYYTHWANMTTWEDEFKMYDSYQQFTQKLWVKKDDVLVDMDGKHPKCGGDMQMAKYPVAIMNPISVKCDTLDGQQHHEWPKINL